jgi:hypothetical protein
MKIRSEALSPINKKKSEESLQPLRPKNVKNKIKKKEIHHHKPISSSVIS